MSYKIGKILHEGKTTLSYLSEEIETGRLVMVKVLKEGVNSPADVNLLDNEYQRTHTLSIQGVCKALKREKIEGKEALVLEYFNGEPITSYFFGQRRSIAEFLSVGIKILQILEELHLKNIIHKNLCGDHILINPENRQIKLIDFEIATQIYGQVPNQVHSGELEGPFTHISPEQTGRMNRVIDARSDLYSLGVTFYEMLTGELPFSGSDPMELIHAHIARQPVPPWKKRAAVPRQVSNIVMRLLEKNVEDRYQSAFGVRSDLEKCLSLLQDHSTILSFPLGEADFTGRLVFPVKLFGREHHTKRLLDIFHRVSQGSTELLLIQGQAGAGKTALVNKIQSPVSQNGGVFIEGKFDRMMVHTPYIAWIQAITGLVNQLLMLPPQSLQIWKKCILEATGSIGKVLADVVPSLELVIGDQPSVPSLGGVENRNRFVYVFQQFIRSIATHDHPLVIFLDNMQWADWASIELLQLILTDPGIRNVWVIGAYRPNEISPDHVLFQLTGRLEQIGTVIERMTITNLSEAQINSMLADTLHAALEETHSLANLIYMKTAGNAFFARQMLSSLVSEGSLSFSRVVHRWTWDIEQLKRMEISENVVDLMFGKLQALPPSTQISLTYAACIGSQFNAKTLSLVTGRSQDETRHDLLVAVRDGLIIFGDDQYTFAHDRVQQAAYVLLDEPDRKATHKKIGELLLANVPIEDRQYRIFDIVNQLNIGMDLFIDRREKIELAELNLLAGRRAKASTAYTTALGYIDTGLRLLDDTQWDEEYTLLLALHQEAAEACYLTGQYERMDTLAQVIHQRAISLMDETPVYEIEIKSLTARGLLKEAIHLGVVSLGRLGMNISEYPDEVDARRQLEITRRVLERHSIDAIIDLPLITAPDKQACMSILGCIGEPAYVASPSLLVLWASAFAEFILREGNSSWSPFAFAAYALVLNASGYIDPGYQLGKMAIRLVEPLDAQSTKCRVFNINGRMIQPWKEPLRNSIPVLDEGISVGIETGDYTSGSFNAWNALIYAFFMGEPLDVLVERIRQNLSIISYFRQTFVYDWGVFTLQAVQRLKGETDRLSETVSSWENKWVETSLQAGDYTGLSYFYLIRLMLGIILSEDENLIQIASDARKMMPGFQGTFGVPLVYFYDSLALLGMWPAGSSMPDETTFQRVVENLEQLKRLAIHAPMNFQNKVDLVEAELARVKGEDWKAIQFYERAINHARENEFVQEEALAYELAAKYFLSREIKEIGKLYLLNSRNCYLQWRAYGKVKSLEEQYPFLSPAKENSEHDRRQPPNDMDFNSILKASQAISNEIDLGKLMMNLMDVVIQNAGARKGSLLIEKDGLWVVGAEKNIDVSEEPIHSEVQLEERSDLSTRVILYVIRTHETVILNDAANEGLFIQDPYILKNKPQSILCLPLINRGSLIGVLYLENNLATGAFPPARVHVLDILATQAAISIENARHFDELNQLNASLKLEIAERKHVEEALRKSEEDYRLLAVNSTDFISRHSPDGTYLYASPASLSLLGYRPEELVGHSAFEFIHPDDLAEVEESRKFVVDNREPVTVSYRIRRKDGAYIWFETASHEIWDEKTGKVAEIQTTSRDISSRKQAEEALRESEEQFRFLIEKAPEAILVYDLEARRFIHANPNVERLFGCDREEVFRVGPLAFYTPDQPDNLPPVVSFREHNSRALAGEEVVFERNIINRQGKHIICEIRVVRLPTKNRTLLRSSLIDITKRVEAEQEIRKLNEELEKRVKIRTAELEAVNRDLESFSYSISHDLRSPLRLINGFSKIIEEDYSNVLDTEALHLLDTIRKNTDLMGRLIDDLLAFSRIGRLEVQKTQVDMTGLVRVVFSELKTLFPDREIDFNLSELPVARGNPMMIRQVWTNLLSNAIKFSSTRKPAVIEVGSYRKGKEDVYYVKDNGVGFDMQYKAKLFGVFQRLHKTSEFEGSGVGLAIVKRIVDKHGGRIWAEGKIDEGSVFYFSLG